MASLRPGEEWARRIMSRALGLDVVPHDDRSADSLYDLTVLDAVGRPVAAVEVTAAAHEESVAYWKAVDGDAPWVDERLTGAWTVYTRPDARVRRLRSALPDLLADFESRGIDRYEQPEPWERLRQPDSRAVALGLTRAWHGPSDYSGRIYVMPPSPNGGSIVADWVTDTASPLADWAVAWISEPDQADNLRKLAGSELPERHLFVLVPAFSVAPDDAVGVLLRMSDEPPLPSAAPILPAPLTHLWLATTWNVPFGIRWSPEQGWSRFATHMLS